MGENQIEIDILGPLEVRVGGRLLPIGEGKRRALVALLALNPCARLTSDRIVDELWGANAPASARHAIHEYVSQLRKVFREAGCEDIVVSQGASYALLVPSEVVDAKRFEQQLVAARKAVADEKPGEAERELDHALSLWRGTALADVELEGEARLEKIRLEEIRLEAIELQFDADLALGWHRMLVPELERLVAAEPLRERFRAQLMLALYRSGRQAEALDVYRDARATLVESRGIEPGPELRRLEQAILRQDSKLDLRPREAPPVDLVEEIPPDAPEPSHARYRNFRSLNPPEVLIELITLLTELGAMLPPSALIREYGLEQIGRVISDGFAAVCPGRYAWRDGDFDFVLEDSSFLSTEEALALLHHPPGPDDYMILAGPWGAIQRKDEPSLISRYAADDPEAVSEVLRRHADRREEWERQHARP